MLSKFRKFLSIIYFLNARSDVQILEIPFCHEVFAFLSLSLSLSHAGVPSFSSFYALYLIASSSWNSEFFPPSTNRLHLKKKLAAKRNVNHQLIPRSVSLLVRPFLTLKFDLKLDNLASVERAAQICLQKIIIVN